MMEGFPRLQAIQLYQKIKGRRILECLDELNRSQWLSRGQLLRLQQDKLHRLLENRAGGKHRETQSQSARF